MPFKNPLTEQLYIQKRKEVLANFSFLENNQHILSFESYFNNSPQKYYDRGAYNDFLSFLNGVKSEKPHKLSQLLKEREEKLSLAIFNLEVVNGLKIHCQSLPKDYDLSLFLNENIHFNLLKLWESPFYEILYLVSYISREKREKPVDGLDLYNVVEELKILPNEYSIFEKYQELCFNTIRNGIGHGKVDFLEDRTKYTDKKGNFIEKSNDSVVTLFDDLVDVVNGFCFALKVFYLTNQNFLDTYKINIPNSIMLMELISGATAPKWEIKACLDSKVQGKQHLNIFIDTDFRDLTTLRLFIFHTGILAAELTNKYNTISLHMKNGLSGLAMFDADKIRQITRVTQSSDLIDYISAYKIDMELLFFSRLKSWILIEKLTTYFYLFQVTFSIFFKQFFKQFRRKFEAISTDIHSKKWYNVVEAKLILDSKKIENPEIFIKENYKSIIIEVVKVSKCDKSIFSKLWLFPAKFVRVQIYIDNVRVREWRNSNTKHNKICTLTLNNTKSIKIPIAFPKSTDIMRKYIILWNSYLDEL